MNTSLYNGVSGLLSFQNALNVESSNISNVNTVGFKSDRISFADLLYQDGVGYGVSSNEPSKNFTQGNLTETSVEYDFAISGEGFFTLSDNQTGATYYTRAGNFNKDEASNLVDVNDNYVLGVLPIITGDKITEDLTTFITTSTIEDEASIISTNTFATDYTKTVTASGVSGTDNKTASDNLGDIEALVTAYQAAVSEYEKNTIEGTESLVHIDEVTFPLTVDANGAYLIEVTINGIKYQEDFDTDVATTLNHLSDNINTTSGITSRVDTATGILTIESMIPNEDMQTANAKLNGDVLTISLIQEESGSGKNLVDDIYTKLQTLIEANGGEIATIQSEIVKTQNGTIPNMGIISLNLDDLGISNDLLGTLENDNGNLYLTQNGASYLVGQLTTVVFRENSSLNPEGNNLYSATAESGDPFYISGKAEILNNFLEISGVELSDSLVNLMVWQRAFEANSKSITTSDELLQTALDLKRS